MPVKQPPLPVRFLGDPPPPLFLIIRKLSNFLKAFPSFAVKICIEITFILVPDNVLKSFKIGEF